MNNFKINRVYLDFHIVYSILMQPPVTRKSVEDNLCALLRHRTLVSLERLQTPQASSDSAASSAVQSQADSVSFK